MAAAGYFSGVSNMVQHALSDVFEDTEWLRGYCTENARRLGSAYAAISGVFWFASTCKYALWRGKVWRGFACVTILDD